MKVYKIRDKNTGLFSTGGMRPKWNANGKSWTTLGYARSHIGQLNTDYTPADIYKNAEVVVAEITEILEPVEDAKDYLNKKYDEDIAHYSERIAKDEHYGDWAQRYLNRAIARKTLLNE